MKFSPWIGISTMLAMSVGIGTASLIVTTQNKRKVLTINQNYSDEINKVTESKKITSNEISDIQKNSMQLKNDSNNLKNKLDKYDFSNWYHNLQNYFWTTPTQSFVDNSFYPNTLTPKALYIVIKDFKKNLNDYAAPDFKPFVDVKQNWRTSISNVPENSELDYQVALTGEEVDKYWREFAKNALGNDSQEAVNFLKDKVQLNVDFLFKYGKIVNQVGNINFDAEDPLYEYNAGIKIQGSKTFFTDNVIDHHPFSRILYDLTTENYSDAATDRTEGFYASSGSKRYYGGLINGYRSILGGHSEKTNNFEYNGNFFDNSDVLHFWKNQNFAAVKPISELFYGANSGETYTFCGINCYKKTASLRDFVFLKKTTTNSSEFKRLFLNNNINNNKFLDSESSDGTLVDKNNSNVSFTKIIISSQYKGSNPTPAYNRLGNGDFYIVWIENTKKLILFWKRPIKTDNWNKNWNTLGTKGEIPIGVLDHRVSFSINPQVNFNDKF